MEFKTTTGGTTTLILDPSEEDWLRKVAKANGQRYEDAFVAFEQLRRANPLSEFEDLALMYGEVRGTNPAHLTVVPQEAGPDGLEDLIELDATIRKALRAASSIQVEATLLQARATTVGAIAIIQTLRELND